MAPLLFRSRSAALRLASAVLLGLSAPLRAQDAPSPEHELPTADETSTPSLAERGRDSVDKTGERLQNMLDSSSRWVDDLFAGDREQALPSARKPYGSVELSNNWSKFYGNRMRLRFDARVDLPALQNRLSGFIGRNNDEDFIRDRSDNVLLRSRFPRVETQDQWLAGLGYSLPKNDVWWADFRVGAHRLVGTELFVQARGRYNAYADARNLVHLRLTPFWTTREGFGITSGADYSHVFGERLLFRWGNIGTVSESRQDLDWRSTLTLYQAVGQYSGLAHELFVRGETGDDVPLHEYGLRSTLRHPLLARRLYGEWVVGYSYPREDRSDQRSGSVQLGLGVEMPFGQPR